MTPTSFFIHFNILICERVSQLLQGNFPWEVGVTLLHKFFGFVTANFVYYTFPTIYTCVVLGRTIALTHTLYIVHVHVMQATNAGFG